MNDRLRCPSLLLFLVTALVLPTACSAPADAVHGPLEGARIGAPFTLVDQDGHRRRDSDFAGRYRIVYFGYTFCPDVCPVDVQTIGAALRAFEAKDAARARRVVPIFITVDPARDTPPVLKAFVSAFHPRMIGLTGDPAELKRVEQGYGVSAQADKPNAEGGYMVAHSRLTFLMDPAGKPVALLPADKTPAEVAAELDRWVK